MDGGDLLVLWHVFSLISSQQHYELWITIPGSLCKTLWKPSQMMNDCAAKFLPQIQDITMTLWSYRDLVNRVKAFQSVLKYWQKQAGFFPHKKPWYQSAAVFGGMVTAYFVHHLKSSTTPEQYWSMNQRCWHLRSLSMPPHEKIQIFEPITSDSDQEFKIEPGTLSTPTPFCLSDLEEVSLDYSPFSSMPCSHHTWSLLVTILKLSHY